MIIELFGVPGSGKTYFATNLCKSNNYIDYHKYRYSFFGKILMKFRFLLYKKSYRYKEDLKFVNEYLMKHNLKVSSFMRDNYILQLSFFHSKLNDKYSDSINKIIVFDEGIIQSITALTYENELPMFAAKDLFHYFKFDHAKYYYVKTNIDMTIENIKKRNRKVCEIDYLEGEELREFLLKEQEIFQFLANEINYEEVPK